MRHDKAIAILGLARRLAASGEGLTIDEMAQHLDASRRTAERARDAVREIFPELEEIADPPLKRFRIPGGLDGVFQAPTAEELAALRSAAELLAREGAGVRAAALEELEAKVLGRLRRAARARLAPDMEALVQAEAIAAHAGPRPFEDESVLGAARQAILSLKTLAFAYEGGRTPGRRREVTPLGILFGRSNYLVACEEGGEPRTWRFDRMREVGVTDNPARPPAGFSLADYASQSFGIYQDEPQDVVLRIAPARAADALSWRFHANQSLEREPSGAVVVRFRAAGMLELAWHLFTWGADVDILAPASLRAQMVALLEAALARHRPAPDRG
ncbi:MAG TPA: WYL domain-containing protein [Caulobacteraceae bacterium]|nr:WYL domain-containing protein [Caulobacteraceae bacterium]